MTPISDSEFIINMLQLFQKPLQWEGEREKKRRSHGGVESSVMWLCLYPYMKRADRIFYRMELLEGIVNKCWAVKCTGLPDRLEMDKKWKIMIVTLSLQLLMPPHEMERPFWRIDWLSEVHFPSVSLTLIFRFLSDCINEHGSGRLLYLVYAQEL